MVSARLRLYNYSAIYWWYKNIPKSNVLFCDDEYVTRRKKWRQNTCFFYYSQIKNIYDKSPFRNKARINFSCTEMYCIELKTLIQFKNSSVSEAHNAKGQPSTAALHCSINRGLCFIFIMCNVVCRSQADTHKL